MGEAPDLVAGQGLTQFAAPGQGPGRGVAHQARGQGAGQDRAVEARPRHHGAGKVGVAEIDLGEVGALHHRAGELG